MGSVQGTIKVGVRTAGHKEWLVKHGYEVQEQPGRILVSGSRFVEEVDLTADDDGKAVLQALIAEKALATYGTKFKFRDGKVFSSIMACGRLNSVSALVVKPVKAGATKSAYDSI